MARVKKLEKLYKKYYDLTTGQFFLPNQEQMRRFVEAVCNFAMDLNKSFDALFATKSYMLAGHNVRALSECCIRVHALVRLSQSAPSRMGEFIHSFFAGQIKRRSEKVTDGELARELPESYARVRTLYKQSCENTHFTKKYYSDFSSDEGDYLSSYGEKWQEGLREDMAYLNESLLAMLEEFIGRNWLYYPFAWDENWQCHFPGGIIHPGVDADYYATFSYPISEVVAYIDKLFSHCDKLLKHYRAKAKKQGMDEGKLNDILRPMASEVTRCLNYQTLINSFSEQVSSDLSSYEISWLKLLMVVDEKGELMIDHMKPIPIQEVEIRPIQKGLDEQVKEVVEQALNKPELFASEEEYREFQKQFGKK